MNIVTLLNQIDSGDIVLPAIQRDFVWSEGKIEKLMDSIMRGYPVGIVLIWETYKDIQYREFEKIYHNGTRPAFIDNSSNRKLKLVLDGQQRLQALYLSLYGSYKGKYLYFDILSGRHSDDFEEEKYYFYFATPEEADEWNREVEINIAKEQEDNGIEYFAKVADLFKMDVSAKQKYRRQVTKKLNLTEDDELRLETNLAKLDEVLTKEQNILKASIIDENKPSDSQSRQTESDVLEIFVRINRQGTPLSRSDLIFSMLKLNWKESATALPEFVDKINNGNSFEIDIDFIIRCLFAVSDLGTKFDIDMLRKKSNMNRLQNNFEKCCTAIESTVDNVQKYCWISSNKAMGGILNLVPFVYYFFHLPKHELPGNQIDNFRKSFFLFCFARPFSRYADSRLGKFIREELMDRPGNEKNKFPFESAVWWVNYWEHIDSWNEELIQRNPRLALYIIQQDRGAKTHFILNKREMDHIFPRSVLRQKGFDDSKVNHFANFWILSKGKNINKTNKHPKKYFEDIPEKELRLALIDKNMLDYRRYKTFLDKRGKAILEKLSKKVGLSEKDFIVLEEE
ncbi:MAG: DUF262 domain-containing protein [Methanobacteriota archaeon]|nr:MAG: DUF262 domain-containing protein [Euryarchaeota archaeon]